MPATKVAINVVYNGALNFTASAPIQRQYALDSTNRTKLRYANLTQDALTLTIFTSSVVIPLNQLYVAAISALPYMSWPPVILAQPTASTYLTHPTGSSWTVSASAETPITYAWVSQSYSQSLNTSWSYLTASTAIWKGGTTSTLTYTTSSVIDNSSSLWCVCTSAAGVTTSSIAKFYAN